MSVLEVILSDTNSCIIDGLSIDYVATSYSEIATSSQLESSKRDQSPKLCRLQKVCGSYGSPGGRVVRVLPYQQRAV